MSASPSLPPGPRIAALQTLRLMRDPYRYYPAMRARYGETFVVPALNAPVLVVTTPEGVKEIFTADPEHFGVFGAEALGPVLGSFSIVATAGETHRKGRKLLTPPFHGARMRAYGETMREVARAHVARLRPGTTFRAHDLTRSISLDVILRTVFGVGDGPLFSDARAALERTLGGFSPLLLFTGALQRPWFPPWRRFVEGRAFLDRLVRDEVERRRARGTAAGADGGAPNGASPARTDILAMLAEARHDDGSLLSHEEIRDHLQTLLVAGHETTAIALAWALYWLARHPEKLERLRAEIATLGAEPEPEAVAKLPYLGAVCDESLRLNTIVPDPVRKLVRPLTVRGVTVPAGMGLCIASDLIHQDASIYPDPAAFRPERFLERKPSPFEFLPFGGGHRRCIGAAFSDTEARIALATTVSRVDLALVHAEPEPVVRRNVTMGPARGVPMRVVASREP